MNLDDYNLFTDLESDVCSIIEITRKRWYCKYRVNWTESTQRERKDVILTDNIPRSNRPPPPPPHDSFWGNNPRNHFTSSLHQRPLLQILDIKHVPPTPDLDIKHLPPPHDSFWENEVGVEDLWGQNPRNHFATSTCNHHLNP